MSTIRKWRNRGRKLGRAGLVSYMGRPAKGALSSFPKGLSATLLRWRQEHPGWGPLTLRKELEQHPAFREEKLPAPASIGRFLKEQGLTKPYERHQELPREEKPVGLPHEVCQITPINVPVIYTHNDPPLYTQDVPPVYSQCSTYCDASSAN